MFTKVHRYTKSKSNFCRTHPTHKNATASGKCLARCPMSDFVAFLKYTVICDVIYWKNRFVAC